MIDVAALIGDIPTTTITLQTAGVPTVNAFGETAAAYTSADITAVVHPTDKRSRLREAVDYTRETISIYVLSADAFDAVRATPAPLVTYAGRVYSVTAVADYAALGGIVIAEAELIDEVA